MPKKSNPLAKCRGIEISPQDATIDIGTLQSYSCEGFDKKRNSLGDITTLVQFTISRGAGGNWNRNVYTSENVGKWQITASYKGKLATAMLEVLPLPEPTKPELPEPLPEPEPPVPEPPLPEPPPPLPPPELDPIAGDVWHSMSPAGQLGDNVCLVYRIEQQSFLRKDGASYLLPDNPIYHAWPYKVILTDYIWLIEENYSIHIHQYEILEGSAQLIDTLTFGDNNSKLTDAILLESGKLLISWYQKNPVDIQDIEIGFAIGNESGWFQQPYVIMPGSHLRQNRAAMAQHPVDGSIWYFQTSDSRGVLKAMSLVENGDNLEVTLINPYFIPYSDNLRPEGEMPTVRAIPDAATQSILVAYQNKDYYFFSSAPPICKGANINVISVQADGAISLRGVMTRWVERISNFSLGVADGQYWLAYGKLYPESLSWNHLYVYYEDGTEKYLGELKSMSSAQGGLYMTNSSDWVIATMDDGYIHFYSME